MAEDFGLLGELCECSGIPGREGRLREIVLRELEPLVDAVEVDKLGNVVGHKKATKGRQPLKLMLAAHMDEIGFVVSHVDDRGLLRLVPLGGHDPRNMVAQRVTVAGKRGDLTGILYPGVKPPHLQTAGDGEKKLAIPDFFVDLCLPPTRVKRDVEVGTMVTIQREFSEIGNGLSCKSIDNRVAIFVMIEAVRRAKSFGFDVYAVATVQEEIGLRGVGVSTFGIEPDVGVAIDTTIAADIPGVPEHERVTAMGGGAAIKLMDSSAISHPGLVAQMRSLAKRRKIKHQLEILPRGGTDAGGMQRVRDGVPVITLSLPARYIHTSVELVAKGDVQAATRLLSAFIEDGHRADLSAV